MWGCGLYFPHPSPLKIIMVSVHGYNKEKKNNSFLDIYLMAGVIGVFVALFLIGGSIGLKYTIVFLIDKWVWVVASILGAVLVWNFVIKKKKTKQLSPSFYNHPGPYDDY